MAEVVNLFSSTVISAYNSFLGMLPVWAQTFINLFLLVLVVVFYSIVIWKFYRFMSDKNIFGLNLAKYNKYEHPFLAKLLAGTLYFVEYLIILPFVIFIWYSIFTLFLVFLIEEVVAVKTILLISATVIAAVRMTAYYNKSLSQDLAKMFPLMLLSAAILNPAFFSGDLAQRIIERLMDLPNFFENIVLYFGFIILLEAILRFFDFVISLFGLEEVGNSDD